MKHEKNKIIPENDHLTSSVIENNRGVEHLLDGNVQAAIATFGNVLSMCGGALKDAKRPLQCTAEETEDPTRFHLFSCWASREVPRTRLTCTARSSVITDGVERHLASAAAQESHGEGFVDWTVFGINSNVRMPFTEASAAFVSSTAIYNLAVSYHLCAQQQEQLCHAKVEKAIKFYGIAHTLLEGMEQNLDMDCVRFLLAILNNTSRCLLRLGNISCAKERCDRVFAILQYVKLHEDGIESGSTRVPTNKVQSELIENYMINIFAWTVKCSPTALAA